MVSRLLEGNSIEWRPPVNSVDWRPVANPIWWRRPETSPVRWRHMQPMVSGLWRSILNGIDLLEVNWIWWRQKA